MRRREFITLLGGAAAALPLAVRAQQAAMPVIGVLSGRSLQDSKDFVAAFAQGLNEVGFFEHRNVAIEYRWAENHVDRLPTLAAELVRQQVVVILAVGGVPPTQAAKAATSIIPIVFIVGGDPIKLGLVASLNRPGGNVTGVTILSGALTAKRLELLRELRPQASVACLVNPSSPEAETQLTDIREAVFTTGKELRLLNVSNDHDLDAAFATLIREQIGGLLLANDAFFVGRRAAVGPADEMNGSRDERRDELGEIIGVGRNAEFLSVIFPSVGSVVSLRVSNKAIFLCDLLSDRVPRATVA